ARAVQRKRRRCNRTVSTGHVARRTTWFGRRSEHHPIERIAAMDADDDRIGTAFSGLGEINAIIECSARNRFVVFLVGKIHSEETHPISRVLIRIYEPICAWSLRWKWLVLAGAVALVVATVPVCQRLGSEFMRPLDEGTLLYMPSTLPGISISEAQRLLQIQDRSIKQFPEVDRVLGKAGRAETSTDPAPFSMTE